MIIFKCFCHKSVEFFSFYKTIKLVVHGGGFSKRVVKTIPLFKTNAVRELMPHIKHNFGLLGTTTFAYF